MLMMLRELQCKPLMRAITRRSRSFFIGNSRIDSQIETRTELLDFHEPVLDRSGDVSGDILCSWPQPSLDTAEALLKRKRSFAAQDPSAMSAGSAT
jgi:hypothetical protein